MRIGDTHAEAMVGGTPSTTSSTSWTRWRRAKTDAVAPVRHEMEKKLEVNQEENSQLKKRLDSTEKELEDATGEVYRYKRKLRGS